jgi:hypothetical protein
MEFKNQGIQEYLQQLRACSYKIFRPQHQVAVAQHLKINL